MMLRAQRSWTFQVVAVVDELLDDLAHVVRAAAVRGDQVEEDVRAAVRRVVGLDGRRVGSPGLFCGSSEIR